MWFVFFIFESDVRLPYRVKFSRRTTPRHRRHNFVCEVLKKNSWYIRVSRRSIDSFEIWMFAPLFWIKAVLRGSTRRARGGVVPFRLFLLLRLLLHGCHLEYRPWGRWIRVTRATKAPLNRPWRLCSLFVICHATGMSTFLLGKLAWNGFSWVWIQIHAATYLGYCSLDRPWHSPLVVVVVDDVNI